MRAWCAQNRMSRICCSCGPRDLAGPEKPNKPEDVIAAFGANLVLTVSLSGAAEALTLELLDPALQRVLRRASGRLSRCARPRIPRKPPPPPPNCSAFPRNRINGGTRTNWPG